MPDNDESLGDEHTFEGGAQPADSSERSLGDRSTFGGGVDSSLSDIGGLTGDADLDMELVDLSRYEVQETLGKGGMGEVLLATDTRLNRKVAIKRMLGDATKSQTAVRRFLTEAQSIAALNCATKITGHKTERVSGEYYRYWIQVSCWLPGKGSVMGDRGDWIADGGGFDFEEFQEAPSWVADLNSVNQRKQQQQALDEIK